MPSQYGRYEIIKSLAEGGQAHTFIVTDTKGTPESRYVLKRLKNPKRIDRFKREIEVLRSMSHPNVLKIVDFDVSVEKPYYVAEYCAGGSLQTSEKFWCASVETTVILFVEICRGVQEAHSKNIFHRDLKPDNIFLREARGPAVVGDFGLSFIEEENRLTMPSEAVGPRLYIAPEYEDGFHSNPTAAGDVYSLGKILYWLLTGEVFSRENFRAPKWDLKSKVPHPFLKENIYMEHFTRLLDYMVRESPEARAGLDNVIASVQKIKKLVELEVNPVSSKLKQRCRYCGWGIYQTHVNGTQTYNFGLQQVGSNTWRILVCSECGHVEFFRPDLAPSAVNNWWNKE